jgi:glycerol-1-phosphate dehydrogenase [NAD(P)+]
MDLNAILSAALRDASVTRDVVAASGAMADLPAIVSRRLDRPRVRVVADETTYAAAGMSVMQHLAAGNVHGDEPLILRGTPRLKPQVTIGQDIAARLRESDGIAVAVGSGVINDLVKYASALAGRPYVCVATAASMDGYTASGAALLDNGFKRTLACAPPIAVVADLDVVARAPPPMASWGYGDLSGKVVAGADWVVADMLGVEPIDPRSFGMMHDHLGAWLDHPRRLGERDPQALGRLLAGLLVSGLAMQVHGSSRPASGSDHQFSHLWEMENLAIAGEPLAHGACVGVGCVAMLALYEWLLAQPIGPADIERAAALQPDPQALEREIGSSFSRSEVANSARREMSEKRGGDHRVRLKRLGTQWPALRNRLRRMLPTARQMQQQLRGAGGVAHPADLGISLQQLAVDHRRARLIRRRYTVLDLVEDLGWLDRAIDALFEPDGFWGRQPDGDGIVRHAQMERADRPDPALVARPRSRESQPKP